MHKLTHRCLRSTLVAAILMAALLVVAAPAWAADSGSKDMYRLYNPNSGEHFYTANASERDSLKSKGWTYEGIGWVAPAHSDNPVYRLYSGTDHHYTMDAGERDSLIKAGWKDEGIGWYSAEGQQVKLYREFNPNVTPSARRNNSGSHNYTTSKDENDSLVAHGWRGEGIGWYALEAGRPDGTKADVVYYTAHGKRYHQSRTCPAIVNRPVSSCTVAEAQRRGLTPCHDCY